MVWGYLWLARARGVYIYIRGVAAGTNASLQSFHSWSIMSFILQIISLLTVSVSLTSAQ